MHLPFYFVTVLFFFSTVLCDENRYAPEGELVIPKFPIDYSGVPTFISDLKKEERELNREEEAEGVVQLLDRIKNSDEAQLEKEAATLFKNPELLQQLIKQFPEQAHAVLLPQPTHQSCSNLISCSFKNTPLSQILTMLSKASGTLLVMHEPVSHIVSDFTINDAPLEKTITTLLSLLPEQYIYRIEQGVYIISRTKKCMQPLIKKTIMLHHLPFSEQVKTRIEALWNSVQKQHEATKRYLIFDEASKKIFCYGPVSLVDEISTMIAEIDKPIPQVRIEARVVIASRDFEESFGIQFSNVYNRRASIHHGIEFVGTGPLEQIANNPPNPQPLSSLMQWAFNLFPAPASACQTMQFPIIFGGNDLTTKRLNIILNAAENTHELKTILKPSLLTNLGEEAEILVGQNLPIQTEVKETIEGTLRDITTATYKDVGTKLRVKPFVSLNKQQILLDLFVENSAQTATVNSFPVISTTRSRNKVIVKNGQTTMIGGLIENSAQSHKSAVPFLERIPLIGWLFKGRMRKKNDHQMLIFITPTIVDLEIGNS